MKDLKFTKMWSASASYSVFEIDHGSIIPMIDTLKKFTGHTDKYWIYYCDGKIGRAYYEENEMKDAAENGWKNFLNEAFLHNYFKQIKITLEKIKEFGQRLKLVPIEKISKKDLLAYFKEAIGLEADIFGYFLACQAQCTNKIEDKTQEKISKYTSKEEVVEVYNLLSTPTEMTSLRKEETDWLELAIKAKEEKDFDKDKAIERHYNEYYLFNAAEGSSPWSKAYFENKLSQDNKLTIDELKRKLMSIKEISRKLIMEQENAIKIYRLDKETLSFCKILARIGQVRLEMRLRGWMPMMYYLENIIKDVAKRFSYNLDLIKQIKVSEVFRLFEGERISNDELKARQKSFLFLIDLEGVKLYSGEKATEEFKKYVTEIDYSKLKEFTGKSAMKGKVVGTALVINWTDSVSEKMKSMTENTILVAGQTRPNLMPLISKSKAIVTDEGGVTSHASIVSRELRIPAVIGTKFATKIVKNGDTIEVDADNGIVRILKRAK